MSKSRAYVAPPEKQSSSFLKVIGGFFRFLFTLAMMGAIGYNTYTIYQLKEEINGLRQAQPVQQIDASETPAERPPATQKSRLSLATSADKPGSHRTPREPHRANPRIIPAVEEEQTPQDPIGQTIAALQQRVTELSAQIDSFTHQGGQSATDMEAAVPALSSPKRPDRSKTK